MATIVWGSWTANSRWRIGIETYYSPTSISASTSSVTVYTNIWFQVQYASNESGQSGTTVKLTSPWAAGPTRFDWNLGGNGTKKILSTSKSYSLNYGSTQKLTMSASATVAYTYPGTGTASTTLTLPARPYTAPAAPTGVTLTRGANEALTVAWTNKGTSAAPYTNVEVQWLNSKQTSWYTGATLSGTTTSYSSTGATDRSYKARVRAKNSVGYSGWVETSYQDTTPWAPVPPTANKNDVGDIVVGYQGPSSGSPSTQYEVWHSANGVWDAARLALISAGTGTWTHANPDTTKTHAYRLRAVTDGPVLYSAYSGTSETVQLQAPPNAPTSLSPNGPTLDDAKPLILTWKHNPTDTTPQKYREIQARSSTDGGVTWSGWTTTGKTATPVSQSDASAWAAFHDRVEWQVRTWGAATTGGSDGTGASPWSSSAIFTLADAPTVAISSPDGSAPVAQSRLTTTWGYAQSKGAAQAQWTAKLYDANGVVLQQLSGNGTDSSVTFPKPVTDASSYTIGVQVTSTDGLKSAEALQPITVDFLEPPSAVVHPVFDKATGTTALDLDVPGPQAADVTMHRNMTPNPAMRATSTALEIRRNLATNPAYRYASMAARTIRTNWCTAPSYGATDRWSIAGATLAASGNELQATATAAGDKFLYWGWGAANKYAASATNTVWTVTADVTFSTSGTKQVYLPALDSTGSQLDAPAQNITAVAGVKQTIVFTRAVTPANTAYISLAFKMTGAVVGETMKVSRVLLENAPYSLPYFDGNSLAGAPSGLEYRWNGTTNAAESQANAISGKISAGAIGYGRGTWRTPGAAEDGTDVGNFYVGMTTNGLIVFSQDAPVAAAGDYVAGRMRVRLVGAVSDMTLSQNLFAYTSAGAGLTYISQNGTVQVPATGEWVDVVIPADVAPTTTAQARFYLTTNNSFLVDNPTAIIQVSNQLIEKKQSKGQLPLPYFDGSSDPGDGWAASWTGAADSSASITTGSRVTGWSGVGAYQTQTENGSGGFYAESLYYQMLYTDILPESAAGQYWSARITFAPDPTFEYTGQETIRFIIHDGTRYVTTGDYVPMPTSPTEFVATSTVATAGSVRVYVYTQGGNSPAPFRFTNFIAERVSGPGVDATRFFDGSTPQDGDLRHVWEGTPDASVSREFIQQQVPATSVEVYASTDLENWRLVGTTDPDGSLTDPIPPLNDMVYYRAHTISDLPSVAIGKDTSVQTESDKLMLVNGGPGWAQSVRIKHNLTSDEDAGLVNDELHRFAGRRKAVRYTGVEEEHSYTIKGTLYGVLQGDDWSEAAVALERAKSSSWDEIVAFSRLSGPMVLRTSWGVWAYVRPGKPSISGRGEVEQQVSWSFEEIDEPEADA